MAQPEGFSVAYEGVFGLVYRSFPTCYRALQWVRQVGKEREAAIRDKSNGEILKPFGELWQG